MSWFCLLPFLFQSDYFLILPVLAPAQLRLRFRTMCRDRFRSFPGMTRVAAGAAPPALLELPTGDRGVMLIHCVEDRLCVWKPAYVQEVGYDLAIVEGQPYLEWESLSLIWSPTLCPT